jgi:hypothetical protein
MLEDFKALFKVDDSVHGVFIPDKDEAGAYIHDDKGKTVGKSFLAHEPITESVLTSHLSGMTSIGGCMLFDGEHTMFSVIDVDVYDDKKLIERLIKIVYAINLPLVPLRSKSGGLHLYTFYSAPIRAEDAIDTAKMLRRLLGLPSSTEIFPKQRRINDGGYGSWINLPYFDADAPDRYVFDEHMNPLPLDIALTYMKERRTTKERIDELVATMPFADGPPCLQTIYINKDTNQRNKYLFAVGVYAKSKFGDGFEQEVVEANSALVNPIPIDELSKTVISSIRKKDYSYTCGDDPLHEFCQRELCKVRMYGIGSENISDLSYEQLQQIGAKTGTPYYRWQINGVPLIFRNEVEIINQQRFRELAMRELHVLPNRLRESRWVAIVNTALTNMAQGVDESAEDGIDEGMLEGGMLIAYIGEFLTQSAEAPTKEQIMMGKVYKEYKSYVFKGLALVSFITDQKKVRVAPSDILELLKRMGGKSKRMYLNKNNPACRVWELPFGALDGKIDDLRDIDPVAFLAPEESDRRPPDADF